MNKEDLLAAALTASYLLPSTRRPLFSDIRLDPRSDANIVQDFIAFLRSAPHLSSLIHHVTFCKRKPHQMLSSVPSLRIGLGQLDELLTELPRLHTLRLNDIQLIRDAGESSIDHHGRYSLKQLVLTDAISEDAVIVFLGWFSRIDELIVSNHWFNCHLWEWWKTGFNLDGFLAKHALSVTPNTSIRKLRLEGKVSSAAFYTELLRRTSTSDSLTSFTLNASDFGIHFTSSSLILNLWQNAAATLVHLVLHTSDSRETTPQMENVREDFASDIMRDKLSALTALRTVTFYVTYRHEPAILRARALAQCGALLLSLPSYLHRISFLFWEKPPRAARSSDRGTIPWYSPELNLRSLDLIFQRFDQLEGVVLGGSVALSQKEQENIRKELREQDVKGLIVFEYTPPESF
ncbi:hypothetical protein EIP86_002532 [Pleurotus ostreatoroseus]|nr:hypothetical protein EIP86_002532 [Pleurotus ostreatoroseus]